MNLHILHLDPHEIPKLLDDKRIGKMLMETNQMMSLAVKHHMREAGADYEAVTGEGKLTVGWSHYSHPVSIWVRKNYANFIFALKYADGLSAEFERRFGKPHASGERTKFIGLNLQNWIPGGIRTEFQNSARHVGRGIDYSNLPIVSAYRSYMLDRWETDSYAPKWTTREDPRPMFEEYLR